MKEKPVNTPESEKFDWQFQTLGDPQLDAMLDATKQFASAMQRKEKSHWFCLLGSSGAGKTHLAKAIHRFWKRTAGWWILQGRAGEVQQLKDSKFISWRSFMDSQREGNFSEIETIVRLPFAIIDDFGAEHDPNGFAKSRLDRIADERLGKWTVFTSNLSLEQIANKIDPRISSRMLRGSSVVIQVDAPDFNIRNLNNN